MNNAKPIYQRVLLKLSGEALQGEQKSGIDPAKLDRVSIEIANIVKLGVQVGIVIGGGNLIRGAELSVTGIDRVTADQMGMLSTVINGIALRDALQNKSLCVKVMSAITIQGVVEAYDRWNAIHALEHKCVTIFVAGTGNPLVTTDSAAALRGVEIKADVVIKATKVDGVFAADPVKNPKAQHYPELTYEEVVEQRLGVMDLNAILICKENGLPLRVFDMGKPDALKRVVLGETVGTLIKSGE